MDQQPEALTVRDRCPKGHRLVGQHRVNLGTIVLACLQCDPHSGEVVQTFPAQLVDTLPGSERAKLQALTWW